MFCSKCSVQNVLLKMLCSKCSAQIFFSKCPSLQTLAGECELFVYNYSVEIVRILLPMSVQIQVGKLYTYKSTPLSLSLKRIDTVHCNKLAKKNHLTIASLLPSLSSALSFVNYSWCIATYHVFEIISWILMSVVCIGVHCGVW